MISLTKKTLYHFSLFCGKTSIFLFLSCFFSSCTKLEKSDKHGSLPKSLPTTCTFLFHLFLRLPGNIETRMQRLSRVSRAFQAVLLENVSLSHKTIDLSETRSITKFDRRQSFYFFPV